MRIERPRPYQVTRGNETPAEPEAGWYWADFDDYDDSDDDGIRGPYLSRCDAEDSIDKWIFSMGYPL